MSLSKTKLRDKLLVLFAFMVVSIQSSRTIPFLKPWGADLHNLHVFQKCAHGGSPYPIDAHACGDHWGRPMIYPPVMYRSFFWLRHLTLDQAMYVWCPLLVLAFSAALYAWIRLVPRVRDPRDHDRVPLVVFGALLLFQYPFAFSLERGSTDAPAVVFWTLAAYWFERRKLASAGAAAGLATAYKLYPLFGCVVVGGGMLLAALRRRGFTLLDVARFGGGALATFVLANAVQPDAVYYFGTVLPRFAKVVTDPNVFSHAIPSFVGADFPLFARAAGLLVVALWVYAASESLATRGTLVLAGALAMSTFGQGTSWDYNLTTTYPLLMALLAEALRTQRVALVSFGVFAICGDRAWFQHPEGDFFNPWVHAALEVAFIVLAALVLARQEEAQEQPLAEPALTR
jgi:hypothetical protein